MKVLFKNRTKYSKEVYEEFLQFHQKQYGLRYQFYTAFIIILIFFCLATQVKIHNYNLAILFCIFLTAFFLWRFLHPVNEIKKELNSAKIVEEKEFSFKFFENHLEITEKLKSEKIKYYKFKHIFETENFFYIYIDKNHAFLLKKDKFVIGNASDFTFFIKKKCPFRFKKKVSYN